MNEHVGGEALRQADDVRASLLQCPRPGCMELWAAWSMGSVPARGREWRFTCLKIPSQINSGIL